MSQILDLGRKEERKPPEIAWRAFVVVAGGSHYYLYLSVQLQLFYSVVDKSTHTTSQLSGEAVENVRYLKLPNSCL